MPSIEYTPSITITILDGFLFLVTVNSAKACRSFDSQSLWSVNENYLWKVKTNSLLCLKITTFALDNLNPSTKLAWFNSSLRTKVFSSAIAGIFIEFVPKPIGQQIASSVPTKAANCFSKSLWSLKWAKTKLSKNDHLTEITEFIEDSTGRKSIFVYVRSCSFWTRTSVVRESEVVVWSYVDYIWERSKIPEIRYLLWADYLEPFSFPT